MSQTVVNYKGGQPLTIQFDFIKDQLGTLIGALIPVLGSVFLIHYSKYTDEKDKYQLYFRRLCELLKYNLEIGYTRIINNTNEINFTTDELSKVISDMENIGFSKSKNLYNDFFELAFSISYGQQLTMDFCEFNRIVFEQTKKGNSNMNELKKIIDSVGLNQVYEFKIIHLLLLLAKKLNLETNFDSYFSLIKSIDTDVSMETGIRYFIIECIKHHQAGISNKVYYIQYALETQKIQNIKSIENKFIESENQESDLHKLIINQFNYYQHIINTYSNKEVWYQYLENIRADSITLDSKHIDDVREMLCQMYEENDYIYLTFLGICENGDALDNNGRSRQKEFMENKRTEPYIAQNRSWYKEAMLEDSNSITITYPYIDTSKSYVVSFVKKIYVDKTIKGIVGLDIVIDDLLRDVINEKDYQLTFFTYEGEIIYDTTDSNKNSKMLSNNIFLKTNIYLIGLIQKNANGFLQLNNLNVYFATIIENKYYCIIYGGR